jgi:hypothetical protein
MKLKRVIAAGIFVCFLGLSIYPAVNFYNAETVVEGTETPDLSRDKATFPQPTIEENEILVTKQENPLETEIINNTIEEESETEEVILNKVVSDYIYTTTLVHIRYDASLDSKILLTAKEGTKLHRVEINFILGWDKIEIDGENYYIYNEYITTIAPEEEAELIEKQIEDSQISDSDLRYMAAIIWAEAGDQCTAGQQAVGIVVMNRVESYHYKDNIYDVLHEKSQFTPVSSGSFDKALRRYDNGEMPTKTIEAAIYALQDHKTVEYNGETIDMTNVIGFARYIKNAEFSIEDHMFTSVY